MRMPRANATRRVLEAATLGACACAAAVVYADVPAQPGSPPASAPAPDADAASASPPPSAQAPATTSAPASVTPGGPRTEECSSFRDRQHTLGALLDVGKGPPSVGMRYLSGYRSGEGCRGLGGVAWLGGGLEARAEGTSAMVTQAVGRTGFMGDTMPFGLEAAVGAGTDFARTIATGSVALLVDFYYLGLGASYSFPIGVDRPAWLGGLEFALRIHVPLVVYDKHEERTTRVVVAPR